jgi:outer membrane lipopolysaccharide assembly protein LptE/RlpB
MKKTGSTLRMLAVIIMLAVIALCTGCISPMIGGTGASGRSAIEQDAISKAAKEALVKPKLEALRGNKVWVDVASISRSGQRGAGSEDEHFLENLIVEALVESGVRVVEKNEAEAVLRVVAKSMGTDTWARVWPHTYLPFMYYISRTATVKIHLYAYDVQDSQMIMVHDGEGTYSWSEWSFFGLGPFR